MVNKQYSTTDLEAFMKLAANWQNTTNHNLLEGVDIKGEMQQYLNSPAMNMYKKRERTQNWNHQEKKFLLDLCRKDMRIIENKRLDAGLTAVKNKAWKIIHQKFSNQFGTDRTCNRLKEQWRRMKACTRNEILDYNNRLTRFGPDVADRKKPSPFTFEVWEFMQEAKKACKSEALDGIDYSKIPLALEEDFVFREEDHNNEDEHDIDDSRTPPQDLCDVDIKEETNEPLNDNYLENDKPNNFSSPSHRAAAAMNHELDRASMHSPTNLSTNDDNNAAPSGANTATFLPQGGSDITGFQPSFNVNNLSATLEALNALRSGQFPTAAAAAAAALQNNFAAAQQQQQHQQQQQQQQQQHHQQQQQLHADTDDQTPPAKRPRTSSLSNGNGCICLSEDMDLPENLNNNNSNTCLNSSNSLTSLHTKNPGFDNNSPEMRAFMEMQNKEHIMRMRILEVQLQAAKYSRDLVEINKTLALQKLQEYASKRLGTT